MKSAPPLADLSDEELAERAKTDGDAFGVLYERHLKRIYNYVYYRTGRAAEAEDLTERVFFQALENLPRYEVRGAPVSAWLFRIAHNLVANWHRDAGRHPTAPIDEANDREDRRADPPADALNAEAKREIRDLVGQLPVERQQLLVMKFVEERSNAEIAREMKRSEGAIKALLHRTLVTLRQQMARAEAGSH